MDLQSQIKRAREAGVTFPVETDPTKAVASNNSPIFHGFFGQDLRELIRRAKERAKETGREEIMPTPPSRSDVISRMFQEQLDFLRRRNMTSSLTTSGRGALDFSASSLLGF